MRRWVPIAVVLSVCALAAIAPGVARADPPAPVSGETYRRRLGEILSRDEFRARRRETGGGGPRRRPPGFVEAFGRWVMEKARTIAISCRKALQWIWERIFGRERDGDPLAAGANWVSELSRPLSWALGTAAVGLLAIVLLRVLRRPRVAAAGEASVQVAAGEAMPDALAATGDAWERFAETFVRDGRWRLAVRALYLAVLSRLHERGAIRYARERTNGEYVAALSARPAQEPFRGLTDLFDRAWYGNLPCDEGGYRSALDLVRAVDAASPAPAGGAS